MSGSIGCYEVQHGVADDGIVGHPADSCVDGMFVDSAPANRPVSVLWTYINLNLNLNLNTVMSDSLVAHRRCAPEAVVSVATTCSTG